MATHLEALVADAVASAYHTATGAEIPTEKIEIRPADRPDFGDYASNVALVAAKDAGTAPRKLAEAIARRIDEADAGATFRKVQVAGPGFLNVFLRPEAVRSSLAALLHTGDRYGRSEVGAGRRIQIEFVSSNPTGPLTVGHGRQAVLGDVLANLYEHLGWDVEREYYYNDEGRQIDLLAESLWVRYREQFGETREIPEEGYRGEYLIPIASRMKEDLPKSFAKFDREARDRFREEAVRSMKEEIAEDLRRLGVAFHRWFSEADLHRAGKVDSALERLSAAGGTYEEDGAVWLKAEEHGGAKDSVLVRGDGRPTYLLVDVAYHIDKRDRGFDRVINVQGADHHAEQSCMKAAMRILGYPEEWLSYAVHQFVSLKESGETLKMSTRTGRFVTLRDLTDELGPDIVRYFMISRKPEAHLDFDLDLARSESLDNPATYVQYAHTRISSIFRRAEGTAADGATADLSPLVEPEEFDLIKILDRFPAVVEAATTSFAPHLLAEYALQLARAFHAYYDKHRVLGEDASLTRARLALLQGLRIVLRESLGILGMNAPEAM
jgi:arginyl-tRNA synthetase